MGRVTISVVFSEEKAGVRRFSALYLLTSFFRSPSSLIQKPEPGGGFSLSLDAAGHQHISAIRTTP